MKSILQFSIEKGERLYVAHGIDIPVVTQAETLDALSANIKEAVELYLEGEPNGDSDIAPAPSILFQYEIPMHA